MKAYRYHLFNALLNDREALKAFAQDQSVDDSLMSPCTQSAIIAESKSCEIESPADARYYCQTLKQQRKTQKHAPEPWFVSNVPQGNPKRSVIWSQDCPQSHEVAQVTRLNRTTNAKRIVACVNACEGIADPSAVPELLAALKVMTPLVFLKYGNLDPGVYAQIQTAFSAIAKAEGKQ